MKGKGYKQEDPGNTVVLSFVFIHCRAGLGLGLGFLFMPWIWGLPGTNAPFVAFMSCMAISPFDSKFGPTLALIPLTAPIPMGSEVVWCRNLISDTF